MANNLVWLLFFIAVTLITVAFVSRERIATLLPFSLWAGAGLALVIQYIAVNMLHLWRFNFIQFPIFGIPLFLILAWTPAEILFGSFLSRFHSFQSTALLVIGFAALSTLMEWAFEAFGYRTLLNWSLLGTFILALAVHSFLAYYLHASGLIRRLREERVRQV